jgi:hypothetical protein
MLYIIVVVITPIKYQMFPIQFQKVVNHLSNSGVVVKLGGSSFFVNHPTQPTIIVSNRLNKEKNGLFILLHEAGHSLQPKNNVGVSAYKNIDIAENPNKTKEFNMLMFMNEVDAWDRGEALAKELDLEIDWVAFNKIKKECLLTYFSN